MSSLASKTLRGVSWTAVEQIASQLIQLGIFILLARLLTKEAFGIIAIANVAVTFLQVFATQGFNDAIIQRKDLEERDLHTAFWVNLLFGFLIFAIGVATASLVGRFFEEPDVVPVLQVLCLSFLFSSLSAIPEAVLRREMDFRPLAFQMIGGRLVGGGAAVWIALQGGGIWSLVALQIISQGVSMLLLWTLGSYRPRFQYGHTACKEMVGFGASLIGFHTVNFLNRRYDIFIMAKFFSVELLGVYSVAQKIIELSISLFMGIFGRVGYPLMCRLRYNMAGFRLHVTRLFDLILSLCVPFALSMVFYADLYVELLFGEKWQLAAGLMAVMAPMLIVRIPCWAEMLAITALGRPDRRLHLGLFASTVSVLLFSVAAPAGIAWFVLAAAVRYYLLALPTGYVFCKLSGIPVRRLLLLHLIPLLVGMGTVGGGYYLALFRGWASLPEKITCLIIGLLLYTILIAWIKRAEIRAICRTLMERAPIAPAGGTPESIT